MLSPRDSWWRGCVSSLGELPTKRPDGVLNSRNAGDAKQRYCKELWKYNAAEQNAVEKQSFLKTWGGFTSIYGCLKQQCFCLLGTPGPTWQLSSALAWTDIFITLCQRIVFAVVQSNQSLLGSYHLTFALALTKQYHKSLNCLAASNLAASLLHSWWLEWRRSEKSISMLCWSHSECWKKNTTGGYCSSS